MKVSWLALSALFAAGVVSKEDKTITKVIKLLQDMLVKSKDESKTEKALYGKFKCYCDKNNVAKKTQLGSLAKTTGLLSSAIDNVQATNGEVSAQTAQLKTDMAENTQGRKDAKNIRDKQRQSFKGEEQDLKQAVGQMQEAIKVLAAIGADQTLKSSAGHKQFMAGKGSLMALGAEVKTALAAASIFLSPEQKMQMGSFLQGPFTATYSAQSGQIVGILKDMASTFKTNLEEAVSTEKKDQEAYDQFMKTKTEAFAAMEASYKEKQETLSSNDEALTSKKKQLQAATQDQADAEEFLSKLTDMCAKKSKDHKERNLMRANEEAAVAQAISILNSDSAFETFGDVSATSTGKTQLISKKVVIQKKAASFLQLQQTSESVIRRELERVLRVGKSVHLKRVLATLEAGNPFEKVLIEIEKMKTLNDAEAKEDKKNLDWCKGETDKNTKSLKDRKNEILSATGDIDELGATLNDPVKGLRSQIKNSETALVQNTDGQGSQTKQRAEENVAYQADVRNLVVAGDLLNKAVAVLTKYYAQLEKNMAGGAAALAQEDPKPPGTWNKFEGQSSKGGDAITMLKFILSETRKEEMAAHAEEEKGQADYEDSMAGLKKEQAKLQSSLIKLNEDLATSEKTLVEKKEDLKDAQVSKSKIEDYLSKIKPGCDFISTNFNLREKNRATETAALAKAIKLIRAAPAYISAVQAAKEKSYGKCRAQCVKDEPGAKCQACLSNVSVPGYCAGHKGSPGC